MRSAFIVLILCLFVTLTASSSARSNATVHIATIPVDAGAEVYYALDQGFFASAGIDPSIEQITNGGPSLRP